MNKKRYKRLEEVLCKAEELREELEIIKDEEQDAHDNLPEAIQWGQRGDDMQEIVDVLEYAVDNLADAVENIEEALNHG